MNQNIHDDAAFEIEEGNEALREYASNLTDSEKEIFLTKLKDDESFAKAMRDALDEMNNLFTIAAVGDDDDYQEAREEVIQDMDNPQQSIHRLRMYYLGNKEELDMSALLATPEDEQIYEDRLAELFSTYGEKHK